MPQMEEAQFVFHLPGAGEIVDELGVWQIPPTEETAFEIAGSEPAGIPVTDDISRWEIILPADPRAAGSALAQHETRLRASNLALRQAQTRMQQFIAAGGSPSAADSFAIGAGRGLDPAPERTLSAWVQTAGEESFAFPPKLPQWAEAAAREVQAFLEKVRNTTRYLALIETSQGGTRQALTVVSWGGDFQSVVKPAAGRTAHDRHRRAVELAVGTRDAWIRMGFIVLRGAVQLGVLFPTNPVLALPAAYKFIRQILEQIQAIQDLQTIHT